MQALHSPSSSFFLCPWTLLQARFRWDNWVLSFGVSLATSTSCVSTKQSNCSDLFQVLTFLPWCCSMKPVLIRVSVFVIWGCSFVLCGCPGVSLSNVDQGSHSSSSLIMLLCFLVASFFRKLTSLSVVLDGLELKKLSPPSQDWGYIIFSQSHRVPPSMWYFLILLVNVTFSDVSNTSQCRTNRVWVKHPSLVFIHCLYLSDYCLRNHLSKWP